MSRVPSSQPAYNRYMSQKCACCGNSRWDIEPKHKFVATIKHSADCAYADVADMPARFCCKPEVKS